MVGHQLLLHWVWLLLQLFLAGWWAVLLS